jgi:hypothetical protein
MLADAPRRKFWGARAERRVYALTRRLRRVLRLLARVQPDRTDGDVLWSGPFFIRRPGEWWPTRFLRYRSELYCTVEIGWSAVTLVWAMERNDVRFEGEPGWDVAYRNGAELWERVLRQVERRLRSALASPAAYNRRVARLLPLRCRGGRIRRRLTWPRRARPPVTRSELERLTSALEGGQRARPWRRLSLRRYLEVTAIAYDAALPELRTLAPREKYERKADQRHGGLLDLRPADARAFERWHASREWLGAHPWEIVFAHPHGILLSPHREARGWRLFLSVDALGLYVDAARMAIALGESGVPFTFSRADEVLATLRGQDWVEVGPFRGKIALDELELRRPGATSRVVWDDLPVMIPLEIS